VIGFIRTPNPPRQTSSTLVMDFDMRASVNICLPWQTSKQKTGFALAKLETQTGFALAKLETQTGFAFAKLETQTGFALAKLETQAAPLYGFGVPASRTMRSRTTLVAASALALLLCACSKSGGGAPEGGGMPPADVNVAVVVSKEITEWDDFTGRVEAKDTIEIRPRVGGYLAAVHFDEGKPVTKGQLLFSIDDREYRAAVETAAANVARAQSRSEVAAGELARSNKLLLARAVSQEEFASRQGELRQSVADVRSAQASLTQARLSLEFTRIESPIAGRIGVALLRPGNLLAPGTSLLATVVSQDPMYVYFEGDERTYLKYQDMAREGSRPSSRDVQNPVRMGLANEAGYPHAGTMDMVDNQLNPQTGSIRARAVFDNKQGTLTPGLFARIQLLGSGVHKALLIHDRAVMTDQDRKYVYVVGAKGEAQRKDVVLGASVEGLRIVTNGLDGTEQVVINGTSKIFFPGAPLKPTLVDMDKPDTQPAPPAAAAPGDKPAAEKQG
jgi:membrane fusion protein, multidrug efflux system